MGVGARVTVGVGVLEATGVGVGSGVSVGRGVGVLIAVGVTVGLKGAMGVTPTQPAISQLANSKQADTFNNKDPLTLEFIRNTLDLSILEKCLIDKQSIRSRNSGAEMLI